LRNKDFAYPITRSLCTRLNGIADQEMTMTQFYYG